MQWRATPTCARRLVQSVRDTQTRGGAEDAAPEIAHGQFGQRLVLRHRLNPAFAMIAHSFTSSARRVKKVTVTSRHYHFRVDPVPLLSEPRTACGRPFAGLETRVWAGAGQILMITHFVCK